MATSNNGFDDVSDQIDCVLYLSVLVNQISLNRFHHQSLLFIPYTHIANLFSVNDCAVGEQARDIAGPSLWVRVRWAKTPLSIVESINASSR